MRLKPSGPSPDTPHMIFPSDAPLDRGGRSLHALYVALNSPVVKLEHLPIGPASAALALHAGAKTGVTLVVRSVRTGRCVFFTSDSDSEDAEHPQAVLDAALSFAESMGFLFDEDAVADRGAAGLRETARVWMEFLGEEYDEEYEDEDPIDAGPDPIAMLAVAEPLEMLLDDLAGEASEDALATDFAPAIPADPVLLLSKFRRTLGPACAARQGVAHARSEPDVRLRLTGRF